MKVDGIVVDLKNIEAPFLNVVAQKDDFVAHVSSTALNDAVGSEDKEMLTTTRFFCTLTLMLFTKLVLQILLIKPLKIFLLVVNLISLVIINWMRFLTILYVKG
jgi:hypothetical protein